MRQVADIQWHELSEDERAALPVAAAECLGRCPWAVAAWWFGSSLVGERPARDVDVALLAAPIPENLTATHRIATDLAAASGIAVIPFDVRLVNAADPVFLGRFLTHRRLIYESNRRARIEWEAAAMSRWLDYRPVWERLRRTALERWAHG